MYLGNKRCLFYAALLVTVSVSGTRRGLASPQTGRPAAAAKDAGGILPPEGGDIPKSFTLEVSGDDYVKREVMIPMRDGVKLHTVIVIPKGARNAPMVLTRTPYNASKRVSRNSSQHMLAALPQGYDVFVEAGYICVF